MRMPLKGGFRLQEGSGRANFSEEMRSKQHFGQEVAQSSILGKKALEAAFLKLESGKASLRQNGS